MPPAERPIPCYIAEPPQEALPYGRWAEALAGALPARRSARSVATRTSASSARTSAGSPTASWEGRTYIPASATTSTGFEVFGYVSFTREHEGAEATHFYAVADYTDETAEANPDWALDLSDEELGPWRGPEGRRGEITLVWGVALVPHGAVATTELGPTTTDQCVLVEDRFTLVSLDNYTGDYIEVRLWGEGGAQLAAESLYEED